MQYIYILYIQDRHGFHGTLATSKPHERNIGASVETIELSFRTWFGPWTFILGVWWSPLTTLWWPDVLLDFIPLVLGEAEVNQFQIIQPVLEFSMTDDSSKLQFSISFRGLDL